MNDFPSFNYRLAGNLRGPALLFLHGFLGDCREWDEAVAFLESDYLCLSIDLPGHGKTRLSGRSEDASIEDVADAIFRLLDTLTISSFSIAGYSMGGRLALHMSVRQPARIVSLVLESASPGLRSDEGRKERSTADEELAARLLEIGLEQFLKEWYSQPMFESLRRNRVPFDTLFNRRLENDAVQLARALRVMSLGRQRCLWREWGGSRIPALLIVGEEDAKFRGIAIEMARACPAAELCVVEGCGHNVHYEDPAAYTRCVKQFLSGCSGRTEGA